MRVLVQADMEGVSHLTDYHELVPCWPAFWATGRAKMTDDVVAATAGLLAGGATQVAVYDQHGSGAANIVADRLPVGVPVLALEQASTQLQAGAFDAVFEVGRHARCGTNDGFVPHTMSAGIAFAIDGQLATESHLNAWRAGLPVLGIVGDDTLASQMDGILTGVPFLAVKQSTGRMQTQPRFPTTVETAAAIRAFATTCAQEGRTRTAPPRPPTFALDVSFKDATIAERFQGQPGLTRTGARTVQVQVADWWRDAQPLVWQAIGAAMSVALPAFIGLDLSTEAALARADPQRVAQAGQSFTTWLEHPEESWWP